MDPTFNLLLCFSLCLLKLSELGETDPHIKQLYFGKSLWYVSLCVCIRTRFLLVKLHFPHCLCPSGSCPSSFSTIFTDLSASLGVLSSIFSCRKKCTVPCPTLKVHNEPMEESESAKYLGNFITKKGGVQDTIEDRRKKGWGKITQIMAILGEVDMGSNRLEAGLLLRESIRVNSLLFSAEAWSALSDKQLARLEVVDTSLLRQLTGGGHSKCPTEFHHLETGTWKLRHILAYRRLMFHHEILSRDEGETIRKIYFKQKQDNVNQNISFYRHLEFREVF